MRPSLAGQLVASGMCADIIQRTARTLELIRILTEILDSLFEWYLLWYCYAMKTVSMYVLKQELASVIAETEAGKDVLITRHNKPVARLTRPGTEHLHPGSQFGKANLKAALRKKTSGRYLRFLEQDRHENRE